MDPVQQLISLGYSPREAISLVQSGQHNQILSDLLPDLSPTIGGDPVGGTSTLNFGNQTGSVSPEIQHFLDQGYTLEEAQQLAQSETFGLNQPATAADVAQDALTTTGGGDNRLDAAGSQSIGNMLNIAGSVGQGVSLEQAAFGLGQSIGAEGPAKTLGIIGNTGKLVFGAARGIASGLGQMKRDQVMRDYLEKKAQEGTGRTTFTPAPQAGNVNYLGGNSFGQDGGTQGETLPLKAYLKNGGFKKPGYKKLM